MFVDVNKYVELMLKHSVSEHQILIMTLLDSNDINTIKLYKSKLTFNKEEFKDLLNRGLIKEKNDFEFIVTIDLFIEEEVTQLFEEILNLYPDNININGNLASAKSIDIEEFAEYYYHKIIKGDKSKHTKLINIIKDHFQYETYAKMGIEKFLKSKEYERVREQSSTTIQRPII